MKTLKVPYEEIVGIDIYGDGKDYNNACFSLKSGDFVFSVSTGWDSSKGVPAMLLEMLNEAGITEKNIAEVIKKQTEE